MRSVEKKISSSQNVYFQLKVSVVYILTLPEELVDLYNFDAWVAAREPEYKVNIFYNDDNNEVMKWRFIDYYEGDSGDITLGLNIGEINAPYKQGSEFYYDKIKNLYSECEKGKIKPGCLLCGTIATLNVRPYKYDGKLASSYTRPIFWPEELSSAEMRKFIENIFAKNGKIVSKIDKTWDEFDGPVEGSTRYSDGYGGYLDDDYINDVLDGDADAYWNLD
ncbi:hypothetical protein ACFST9_05040 [Hymenobacter monticola]